MDILSKVKIENSEKISKKSMNQEKEKSENNLIDEDDEITDRNEKIEKKEMSITKTTVADELKESKLEPKENFDLLKINLKFLVKKEFIWVVYRTPLELQKLLKKLYKIIKSESEDNVLFKLLEKLKDYTEFQILNSIEEIQEEFNKILKSPYFDNNIDINEFLNIGGSSFSVYNNGVKPFEGYVLKKADPHCLRKVFSYMCACIECCFFKKYNERWFVLKDDIITYSDYSVSSGGKHVYFFDEGIKAVRNGKLGIRISNLSRILELKFNTYFEREIWKKKIEEKIKQFKNILKNNRFKAFANEKMNNFAHWFVDCKDYFDDLYEKLMGAKRTIFMTDWWMSPEVWLKRPILETEYTSFFKKKSENSLSRLMDILEHKAKSGVKIYILLYYECSLALKINSKHTEDALSRLHKNIFVTRHPTNKLDLMWSHHEKLVIIDHTIGFVGGLDLCWGRYDTNEHPIYEAPNFEKKYYYPFIDYSNARICDFTNVDNYLVESVPRETSLRMPWHDVHTRLIGPVVNDITRHFIERWNHARFEDRNKNSLNYHNISYIPKPWIKGKIKKGGFLDSIIGSVTNQKDKGKEETGKVEEFKIGSKREENGNSLDKSSHSQDKEDESISFDIDKNDDMTNINIKEAPIFNCQKNSLKYLGNGKALDTSSPRKQKKLGFKKKFRQSLTQREIKNQTKKRRFDDEQKFESAKKKWMETIKEIDEDHFFVPKTLGDKLVSEPSSTKNVLSKPKKLNFYKELINKIKTNKKSWFSDIFKGDSDIDNFITDKYVKEGSIPCNVQVLRSVGEWSLGLKSKENSILEAYYQLIENSQHYIFIENQFFISRPFDDNEKQYLVETKIALYLINRIIKAAKNKEKFRVCSPVKSKIVELFKL